MLYVPSDCNVHRGCIFRNNARQTWSWSRPPRSLGCITQHLKWRWLISAMSGTVCTSAQVLRLCNGSGLGKSRQHLCLSLDDCSWNPIRFTFSFYLSKSPNHFQCRVFTEMQSAISVLLCNGKCNYWKPLFRVSYLLTKWQPIHSDSR